MQSPTNTISVFFCCTILVVCFSHQSDARDTITTSNPLRDDKGERLVSANGIFELGFFPLGGNNNSYVGIWYHNLPQRVVVWVANRDNPVTDSSRSFAMAEDGNLKVLSQGNHYAITQLKNTGVNRTVKLMNNGNLIIFDGPSPSERLWQSFHHPTDTFLPGMTMDVDMVLTSWSNSTNPAKGDYTFRKDQEFYKIQNGSNLYWRSGEPGLPFMQKMTSDVASFLSGTGSINPSYDALNKTLPYNLTRPSRQNCTLSRLFMNSTGEIQYYCWFDGKEWTLRWSEPRDRCSVYNACGKSSICDSNNDPRCQCLPGFQPVSIEDSNYGDYSGGCERRISCNNTADKMKQSKFLNLSLDYFGGSFQQFDKAQKQEECEKECRNDCKCNAYYIQSNASLREGTGGPVCWIGTGDLEDLRWEHGNGEFQLSACVAVSDIGNSSVEDPGILIYILWVICFLIYRSYDSH